MRISDWSSDVCSSDLQEYLLLQNGLQKHHQARTQHKTGNRAKVQPAAQESAPAVGRVFGDENRCAGVFATHRKPLSKLAYQQQDRRSEEHTSELQSLMRISYAVFCLKKTKTK